MDTLAQALRGATRQAAAGLQPLESVLVVGGGGVLGSALLAETLVAGRFQRVAAVVDGPLASAVRGFEPLPLARLQAGDAQPFDLAFIVFERGRHSNGRDDAFHLPQPADLQALSAGLRAVGVRRLLVVVPHAPALLPQALKAGFASMAEAAVAALGFEHLVFLRAAQTAAGPTAAGRIERFAAWWLAQLSWMVPQREQPVRAVTLARLVVQLARQLPGTPPATRVLPSDVLWLAAQVDDPAPVLAAWLALTRGRPR